MSHRVLMQCFLIDCYNEIHRALEDNARVTGKCSVQAKLSGLEGVLDCVNARAEMALVLIVVTAANGSALAAQHPRRTN